MFRNYSSPYGDNNGGSLYPARDVFDTRENLTARRNSAEARNNDNVDMQVQSRRITRVMNFMNIAFFVLLISGAALTAVITLIAKSGV
ncbi:unnamed protein product [Cylicocyclus nassatus]|uniref:Uncharacterized protein n=1 Tax=Cylicocyclus nassatus TaxID=53992 RepID=A0AA36MC48_CYLNA|nr:unnamed protein product [Cylicocyclus nassatus]